MKYIRENGTYFFAECESCGNELKSMRAHCTKQDDLHLKVNRPVLCSCGNSSDFIILDIPAETVEDLVKCPKCQSTQVAASNKGFGLGKAAVGGVLLGPVGLLGGLFGSKKLMISCMRCGHKWQAGS